MEQARMGRRASRSMALGLLADGVLYARRSVALAKRTVRPEYASWRRIVPGGAFPVVLGVRGWHPGWQIHQQVFRKRFEVGLIRFLNCGQLVATVTLAR